MAYRNDERREGQEGGRKEGKEEEETDGLRGRCGKDVTRKSQKNRDSEAAPCWQVFSLPFSSGGGREQRSQQNSMAL